MAKTRTPLPPQLVSEILYASRRGCCFCERADIDPQIHHIDDNPSNNSFDNLVVLCPNHHSDVAKRGGAGRALTPNVVKHHRNKWYTRISEERATSSNIRASAPVATDGEKHRRPLDLLTVFEIRKCRLEGSRELSQEKFVRALQPFTAIFDQFIDYGPEVAEELIAAASDLAANPRGGISFAAASTASELVHNALPFHNLRGRRLKPIEDYERELFRRGISVATDIVYDAAKYLQDLAVLDAGARLLHDILRFATINAERELRAEAKIYFRDAISDAKAGGFSDGAKWLEYLLKDAISDPKKAGPPLPFDIQDRVRLSQKVVGDNELRLPPRR